MNRILQLAGITVLIFFSGSCGLLEPKPPAKAKPVLFEWQDDRGPGELSVHIDLTKQIATYRRGNREIGWSFVSSGIIKYGSYSSIAYSCNDGEQSVI